MDWPAAASRLPPPIIIEGYVVFKKLPSANRKWMPLESVANTIRTFQQNFRPWSVVCGLTEVLDRNGRDGIDFPLAPLMTSESSSTSLDTICETLNNLENKAARDINCG